MDDLVFLMASRIVSISAWKTNHIKKLNELVYDHHMSMNIEHLVSTNIAQTTREELSFEASMLTASLLSGGWLTLHVKKKNPRSTIKI